MLKRLTDEQVTMVQLAVWAPAGSDRRNREKAATRWKTNVARLQELMGEVLGQIKAVGLNLSETKETCEPWVGLLEWVALELAEKDWTSPVESDAADLPTVMATGSMKVEEVRWEVASLKAGLSDCSPTVQKDRVKPEQELTKLK
jgi:hypothetical protein